MLTQSCTTFDEAGRLDAIERLEPELHSSEATFKRITELVSLYLGLRMSTVSIVMRDSQLLKARQGFDMKETPRSIAFCDITIRSSEPLIIEDTHEDARVRHNPLVTGEPFLRSYIGVPLTTSDGYNLGSLCAFDTCTRRFDQNEIEILRKFGDLVMSELELRAQASQDFLTGAMNRRTFVSALESELARISRRSGKAAIAYFDIDHFKKVNDTYGHPTGDRVLKEFTKLIEAQCRVNDQLARLGGEEFAVLLPDTDLGSAQAWAERMRQHVARHEFGDNETLQITTSIGLVEINEDNMDLDLIMEMADESLYRAKRRGRNRVAA